MAAGAAYYFNMTGFNKQAITPDFPARHVAYMLNRNKVLEVGSQHAPVHFWQAQDWLEGHYTSGRKNARVWTRFILNLPYDLTHAQRVALVKAFLAELSRGRAQFVWAIHRDTAAPHAHVVFVDKDVDNGRRVAKLSEAGSVGRWGKVWEDCCNRALEWAGSLSRVSRHGKESAHFRELNAEARRQRGQHLEAATALQAPDLRSPVVDVPLPADPVCHQQPPAEGQPVALQERQEVVGQPITGDRYVDAVIEQERPEPTIAAVVAFVASQMTELERLRAAKQTIADYRATYAQVTAQSIRAQSRLDSIDFEMQRAGSRVIKAEQEAARHKGVFNRLWQIVSPAARASAKAAKTASEMAVFSLSTAQVKANSLLREAQILKAEQTALQDKANALKASLAIYGTEEDIDEAEKSLMRTIAVNTAELSATELSQALLAGHITQDQHRRMLRAIDRGGIAPSLI